MVGYKKRTWEVSNVLQVNDPDHLDWTGHFRSFFLLLCRLVLPPFRLSFESSRIHWNSTVILGIWLPFDCLSHFQTLSRAHLNKRQFVDLKDCSLFDYSAQWSLTGERDIRDRIHSLWQLNDNRGANVNRKCKLQIIERVRHVIYWQMQFHRQDSIEKLGFALNFSTTQPSLCELRSKI